MRQCRAVDSVSFKRAAAGSDNINRLKDSTVGDSQFCGWLVWQRVAGACLLLQVVDVRAEPVCASWTKVCTVAMWVRQWLMLLALLSPSTMLRARLCDVTAWFELAAECVGRRLVTVQRCTEMIAPFDFGRSHIINRIDVTCGRALANDSSDVRCCIG